MSKEELELLLVLDLVPLLVWRQAGKFSSKCKNRVLDIKYRLHKANGMHSTDMHHCCSLEIRGAMAIA